MRSFNLLMPLLILAGFFAPFARSADTLTSKDGRLQIQIPGGYSEKTPPKPTIKLEAGDDSANTTVLVLSDSQQDFASLAKYADFVRDQMTGRLQDAQTDAATKLQAGEHPAIRFEITGISSTGQRMAFLVTVIQTETRFNQVVGSCSRPDFAAHKADFATIADSLKELPPKPDKHE